MRYSFGNCILDTARYELLRAGHPVPLRPKIFQVLTYLLAHRNRVVSKDELLEQCWPNQFVGDAPLHACITAVRKAIGDHGGGSPLLGTMRSRGYRFIAPVQERDSATDAPPPPPVAYREALVRQPGFYSAIGERKPVTVLYCALATASAPAACLELEALYHLVQTMGAHAQDVARHYEGTMIHVSGEGVTVLFGAPVAHEDHARRAVLAALELRQRLALGERVPLLTASMGLHTGLMVVGRLSQTLPWMYTSVGDTTHLAIQLQHQAAPDVILLSAATYRLVQEEIQGALQVPLEVGGTHTPVYAVQGCSQRSAGVPGAGTCPRSCYVGRERELALLHERLVLVAQGRGQVVSITGAPGSGKSRLLREFRHRLCQPMTYYAGHCLAYERATPYGLVRMLLRQCCGMRDEETLAQSMAQLRQRLQAVGIPGDEGVALLRPLLETPAEAAPPPDPHVQWDRTWALLEQILLHEQRRLPIILAIENLHWIDSMSEVWLASLVRRLPRLPVLLLVTYRAGYHPRWLEQVPVTQIALLPLLPYASRAIVQSMSSTTPLPDHVVHTIVVQAAGNPFFVQELTWAAMAQGGGHTPCALPETILAVVGASIDRLSSTTKQVLQTAAVLGQSSALPLLHAVTELSEETLLASLRTLQEAEFLYETTTLPPRTYTFKHALVREAVVQSLLPSTQQEIQQRVAQQLATGPRASVIPQPVVLLNHKTLEESDTSRSRPGLSGRDGFLDHEALEESDTLLPGAPVLAAQDYTS